MDLTLWYTLLRTITKAVLQICMIHVILFPVLSFFPFAPNSIQTFDHIYMSQKRNGPILYIPHLNGLRNQTHNVNQF